MPPGRLGVRVMLAAWVTLISKNPLNASVQIVYSLGSGFVGMSKSMNVPELVGLELVGDMDTLHLVADTEYACMVAPSKVYP